MDKQLRDSEAVGFIAFWVETDKARISCLYTSKNSTDDSPFAFLVHMLAFLAETLKLTGIACLRMGKSSMAYSIFLFGTRFRSIQAAYFGEKIRNL